MEKKTYHHLREQDRVFLNHMLRMRYPKSRIADILGVHRSTIYREIKRNSHRSWKSPATSEQYLCIIAQRKYLERRKRQSKIVKDQQLRTYIHDKLQVGWSPWRIEGRLKREHEGSCLVSHETIYRYIYSDDSVRNCFYKKLRRQHFWRIKHHARKPRVPITSEPQMFTTLFN